MKKTMFFSMLFLASVAFSAELEGFYKTVDEKTGKAKSIVRLYQCGSDLCGRIIALYNEKGDAVEETLSAPARVAEEVKGKPKMTGLDIVWNMKWDSKDKEYSGGKILDPKSGSVYSCVIWQDKKDANTLLVKGKIGPIGRTQKWQVMSENGLPADLKNLDVSKWTPKIIK